MSALSSDKDRRGAQRHALPKPVPATYGGFPATLVEFSLTGCRIQHVDRITPRVSLPFRFTWRGKEVRLQGTLVRSEMIPVQGKPAYVSGLEFCETPEDAPEVVRDVVAWLVAAKKEPEPAPPAVAAAPPPPTASPLSPPPRPAVAAPPPSPAQFAIEELPDDAEIDEEPETLSTQYLQCTFSGGRWQKLYVDSPKQPANGFTILAPSNEREADVLCRAFEKATDDARRAMRASFEQAIARSQR